MRCPKCQYLGFEGQDRCRNCGYDLSLSGTLPSPETPVAPPPARPDDSESESDLPLRTEPTARERARAAIRQRAAASRTPSAESFDLPLFSAGPPEVAAPSPSPSLTPRTPLSVRRATVEPPHLRGAGPNPTSPPLAPEPVIGGAPAGYGDRETPDEIEIRPADADPSSAEPLSDRLSLAPIDPPAQAAVLDDPPPVASVGGVHNAAPTTDMQAEPEVDGRLASIGARVTSGVVDLALLGAIDAVVLAFTLRLTGVEWTDLGRLPPAPLAAFMALLATGYLSMFTLLAGQTIGQMVADTRVVDNGGGPVRLGHAVLRAVVQVLTVPLLAVGFVPALLGADRRALYDRLSDTHVVRGDA